MGTFLEQILDYKKNEIQLFDTYIIDELSNYIKEKILVKDKTKEEKEREINELSKSAKYIKEIIDSISAGA